MIKILEQPYPPTLDFNRNMKINFFIGCFIALFLIFFQPFGNAEWTTAYKPLKLAGYGLVSFVAPTICQFLLLRVIKCQFDEEKWNIFKEVLWLLGIISVISLGNVLYSYLLGITSFSFKTLINTFIITCALGIFPVFANIMFKYHRYKALNQSGAKMLDDALINYRTRNILNEKESNTTLIELTAENNKDALKIDDSRLLYLESLDNYTQIVFTSDIGIQKEILRGSLSSFEAQISRKEIIRCHRSYMVNLSNAKEINGNAQGYKISLHDGDKIVPVSRSYGKEILEIWDKK